MVLLAAERTPDDTFIAISIETITKYAMKRYERLNKTGWPFLGGICSSFFSFGFDWFSF